MAQVEVVDDLDKLFCSKTVAVCYKQVGAPAGSERIVASGEWGIFKIIVTAVQYSEERGGDVVR